MSMMYRIQLPITYTKRHLWNAPYHEDSPIYPSVAEIEVYKKWCKNMIGPNGWNYYGMYREVPCEFRFKKAEDLVAFKLTFIL